MDQHPKVSIWQLPRSLGLDVGVVSFVWAWGFCPQLNVVYPTVASYFLVALLAWFIALLCTRREEDNKILSVIRYCLIAGTIGVSTWLALCVVGQGIWAGFFIPLALLILARIVAVFRNALSVKIFLPIRGVLLGFSFAMATAIPAWFDYGMEPVRDVLFSPQVLLLGLLCAIWFCSMDAWKEAEHDDESEISLSVPLLLLAFGCYIQGVMRGNADVRWFFYAIGTSAALLQILNRVRSKFSNKVIIALSFAVMAIPVLFLVN